MTAVVTPYIELVEDANDCNGIVLASVVRPATHSEIELAQEMHERGECPHVIIVDERAWMFDFRNCYTCGAGLGVV